MPVAESAPQRRLMRLAGAPLLALAIAAGSMMPLSAHAATTWTRNLWVASAYVSQDPYYTGCVAASAMTMLNTIAYRHTGGRGFAWTPYRVRNNASNPLDHRDLTSVLAFARRRDTLRASSAGTDAHGWRNTLNAYGWGMAAMTDPAKRVYDDRSYSSMDAALKAAVRAIARFGLPVGVLTWAGGHAQVMTGYVVVGADPRVSSDFQVRYVYLSDPLRSSNIVNRRVGLEAMRTGNLDYRFQRYRESDSPYDDAYTAGTRRSAVLPGIGPSEWYQRWVVILAVRAGLPTVDPGPDPTPVPTEPPSPGVSQPPAATPQSSPFVEPAGSEPAPTATRPPATDAPASQAPATEAPATEAPVAEPASPAVEPASPAERGPTPTLQPPQTPLDAPSPTGPPPAP